MGFLSRKDIISAAPRFAVEEVAIKDWGNGGKVLVQGGSGTERDEYELSNVIANRDRKGTITSRETNLKLVRRSLVARACVEPPDGFEMPADGRCERLPPLFRPEDAETLAALSSRDLDAVFSVAAKLWGIGPQDVEELAGESKPGRSAGHGMPSPVNGASVAVLSNES